MMKISKRTSIIMVMVVLILCMAITSCQPTPEKLIVQNKADGELMDKINSEGPVDAVVTPKIGEEAPTDSMLKYKVVDHVVDQRTLVNGMELRTDADMLMPDVETFPVIKYRRKDLNASCIEKIMHVLCNDQALYAYEIPITKPEIDDIIVSLRGNREQKLQEGVAEDSEEIENINRSIAMWLDKYETAPEKTSLVPHRGDLSNLGGVMGKVLCRANTYADIVIQPQDGNGEIDNQSIGVWYSITGKDHESTVASKVEHFRSAGNLVKRYKTEERWPSFASQNWCYDYNLEPVENAGGHITMTKEEAIQMAEDTFHSMGAGDDVKVSNIYYLKIPEDVTCPKKDIHCYAIELKRYVDGGMPINKEMSSREGIPERADYDAFNANVPYESMSVFISDEGIVDLEWREPLEQIEIMNTNIELAPSTKVMDVFWQEFKNAYSAVEWRTEESVVTTSTGVYTYFPNGPINLYKVKLDYGLARIPNERDTYMAIPLWDFFAVYYPKSIADQYSGFYHVYEDAIDYSLITINGIDNTRFNRWGGY